MTASLRAIREATALASRPPPRPRDSRGDDGGGRWSRVLETMAARLDSLRAQLDAELVMWAPDVRTISQQGALQLEPTRPGAAGTDSNARAGLSPVTKLYARSVVDSERAPMLQAHLDSIWTFREQMRALTAAVRRGQTAPAAVALRPFRDANVARSFTERLFREPRGVAPSYTRWLAERRRLFCEMLSEAALESGRSSPRNATR